MSQNRGIPILLALPVLIGLLAGIAYYGLYNVLAFLIVLAVVLMALGILARFAKVLAGTYDRPDDAMYQETDLDRPMKGGTFTAIDQHRVRLDTKEGTSFVLSRTENDAIYVQQIDPKTGRWIGQPFLGQDSHGVLRTGQVTGHIKRRSRRKLV